MGERRRRGRRQIRAPRPIKPVAAWMGVLPASPVAPRQVSAEAKPPERSAPPLGQTRVLSNPPDTQDYVSWQVDSSLNREKPPAVEPDQEEQLRSQPFVELVSSSVLPPSPPLSAAPGEDSEAEPQSEILQEVITAASSKLEHLLEQQRETAQRLTLLGRHTLVQAEKVLHGTLQHVEQGIRSLVHRTQK